VTRSAPLAPRTIEAEARPLGRFGVAFGHRTTALLLLGLIWWAPAFVDVRFVWAMLAWDGVILALWLVDLERSPLASRLRVRRTWLAAPALSVRSTVEIAITNVSG
jgi:hypothetical protein